MSSSQLGVQWVPLADGDLLPWGRRGGEAGGAPVSLPRRFVLGHPVGWDSVAGASQLRSPSKQHLTGGVRIKKKRRRGLTGMLQPRVCFAQHIYTLQSAEEAKHL